MKKSLVPKKSLAALLAALAVAALACKASRAPVASLSAEPKQLDLPYPGVAELKLVWRIQVGAPELGPRPFVFVHLLEAPGSVVRTFDHPLPANWHRDEPVEETVRLFQSSLGEPLPPGQYAVSVGLYDPDTKIRFPLATTAQDVDRQEYQVAVVRVPDNKGAMPRFEFSSDWLRAEYGTDRQLLVTRWLAGTKGTLKASGLPAGSSLFLQVRIASGGKGLTYSRQPAGESEIILHSGCAPEELRIVGDGHHVAELAVPAGKDGCEIELEANFTLTAQEWHEARSAALEILAIRPAQGGGGAAR